MNFTRIKTTMMAGVLAASMILPGMTAFAAETAKQPTEKNPQIVKTVDVDKNVSEITGTDAFIRFKVEQTTNSDGVISPKTDIATRDIGISVSDPKNITPADIIDTSGLAWNIDENGVNTTLKAGEYTFKVYETTEQSKTDFGWTEIDDKVYIVHVYVDNTGKVTYGLTYITDEGKESAKVDQAKFNNTYNKKSEKDGKTYKLTVTKNVLDKTYVAADQDYEITITFTVPSQQKTVTDAAYTTSVGTRTVSKDGKTVTIVAKIKDKGSIVVDKIAVGATYTVEETSQADLGANFVKAQYKTNTAEKAVDKLEAQTFAEADASVEVQNTFKEVTVTGVVTSIAPYVTLVVLAVAAIAAYMAMKARVAR